MVNFVIPEINTKFDSIDTEISGVLSLESGKIMVGNVSNVATDVAMSGDVTIAATGVTTIGAEKITESKLESAASDSLSAGRLARVTYDFAVNGGTIGTIGLGLTLPDNAIIRRAWYDVITTATSATDAATIAINIPTDGDLVDAIAISAGGNAWDAGLHDIVNAANVAEDIDAPTTYLKLTDAREVSVVVAVEDLTAGKFIIFIDYTVSE